MYKFIYLASFVIRTFFLQNPFIVFGEGWAFVLNTIFSVAVVKFTYLMVGLIYVSGENPAKGSILFFIVYCLNSYVTALVCRMYPVVWLMFIILMGYIAAYIFIVSKIETWP